MMRFWINVVVVAGLCFQLRTVGATADSDSDTSTLRLVHVLYRHGDRSPVRNYPKDPVKESDWPQGWGQLSQVGMQQEFLLGQSLKQQYISTGFLSETYKKSKVHVRSTDKDRTLMSAYSVLAGLFPPNGTQVWNDNITWQPIPVHTIPLKEDNMLYSENPCPKFTELKQNFLNTNEEVKKFKAQNSKFFQYVADNTGVHATMSGVFSVLDTLFCEDQSDKLPDLQWLKAYNTFQRLMDMRDFAASLAYPTVELARLKAGTLVRKIRTNMDMKIKSELTEDMILYSAHDSTVIFLLKALDIYNDKQPPYSTSVAIELHEPEKSKYTIHIYLRNDTNSSNVHLHKLTLPGCGVFDCPYDKFKTTVSGTEITDIQSECSIHKAQLPVVGVAVLGAIVALLALILAAVCCMYYRLRKSNLSYQPLPTELDF